jgi:hypothetical protein
MTSARQFAIAVSFGLVFSLALFLANGYLGTALSYWDLALSAGCGAYFGMDLRKEAS